MSIATPTPRTPGRSRSYLYCEGLTRAAAANFYPAFQVLPRAQRRGMTALYAFMRIADDLADAPAPPEVRRLALADYRSAYEEALRGSYRHPVFPALNHVVRTFGVPRDYLDAVLDGVEMDLEVCRFDRFPDLYRYCYRVASAVGLACVHVWGFRNPRALDLAEKAGIAFQLTNILRDLGEDARSGRVYLPTEDMDRFGCTAEQFARGERGPGFDALMRFQVGRARDYYREAAPLLGLLSPEGRAVYQIMERTYRGMLEAIEQRGYDVFTSRVRLARWQKLGFLLSALPVRWGWF